MTDNSKQNNNQNQEKKIYKEAIDKIIKSIQEQGMKLEQYFNITTSTNNKTTITNKGYVMEVIQDFVMNNAELAEYYNMFGIPEFEGMLEGALKKIVYKEVEEKNQEQIKGNIKNFMEHFNEQPVKIQNIQNSGIDNTEEHSYFGGIEDTELKISNQQQPKQDQEQKQKKQITIKNVQTVQEDQLNQGQVPQQRIHIKNMKIVNEQKEDVQEEEKIKFNNLKIGQNQTQQEEQNKNSTQEKKQKYNNYRLDGVSFENNTKTNSNSSCLFFDKDGRVVENVISDKDKKNIETRINYFSDKKNGLSNNKNPFEVDKDTTDYIKKQMGARGATDGAMAVVSNTGNPANPNEKQLNILMIGNPDIKVILHVINDRGEKVDWEMTIDENNKYTIIDENREEIDPDTLTNIKIPGIHREKSVEIQQEQNQEQKQEEQNQEQGQEQSQEEQNKPTVQGSEGENTQEVKFDTDKNINTSSLGKIGKVNEETPINSTTHVEQLNKSKNENNMKSNNTQSSRTYNFK